MCLSAPKRRVEPEDGRRAFTLESRQYMVQKILDPLGRIRSRKKPDRVGVLGWPVPADSPRQFGRQLGFYYSIPYVLARGAYVKDGWKAVRAVSVGVSSLGHYSDLRSDRPALDG